MARPMDLSRMDLNGIELMKVDQNDCINIGKMDNTMETAGILRAHLSLVMRR